MSRRILTYNDVERRILELLRDGKSHPREKVLECLQDSEAGYDNLRWHMHNLRKKIVGKGFVIVCESRPGIGEDKFSYRMERRFRSVYRHEQD